MGGAETGAAAPVLVPTLVPTLAVVKKTVDAVCLRLSVRRVCCPRGDGAAVEDSALSKGMNQAVGAVVGAVVLAGRGGPGSLDGACLQFCLSVTRPTDL